MQTVFCSLLHLGHKYRQGTDSTRFVVAVVVVVVLVVVVVVVDFVVTPGHVFFVTIMQKPHISYDFCEKNNGILLSALVARKSKINAFLFFFAPIQIAPKF